MLTKVLTKDILKHVVSSGLSPGGAGTSEARGSQTLTRLVLGVVAIQLFYLTGEHPFYYVGNRAFDSRRGK